MPEDARKADVILVMDYLNKTHLVERFPEAAERTWLFGQSEIDDPYADDLAGVREVFRAISARVDELAAQA